MLLMGLELFYVQDPHGIRRMNTMFKIYYQVWVFMAIASAFGLYWLAPRWRPATTVKKITRALWWVIYALLKVCYRLFVFRGIASAFGLHWLTSRWRPATTVKKIGQLNIPHRRHHQLYQ